MTERRVAPAAFEWSVFPVVMSASVASCIGTMASGVSPPQAILLSQLGAFAVVAIFEQVYPYHRSRNQSRDDVRVDATHSINIGILVALVTQFVEAGGAAIGGWLSSEVGAGLWPSQAPLPVQPTLALVIGELPGYTVHRIDHAWEPLCALTPRTTARRACIG